jgi:hypothetical protein
VIGVGRSGVTVEVNNRVELTQGDPPGGRIPAVAQKSFTRKVVESVVVVAAGLGLMALGTFGSFTDPHTPLPPAPVPAPH